MFKIAKLDLVEKEDININLVTQEEYEYADGKKVTHKSFETLAFEITGKLGHDEYCFNFELNCPLEELLKLPKYKTLDFNKYIFGGETWFNVNDLNGIEPEADIKITRYMKNKFIIFLSFYLDHSYDNHFYCGEMEITFNLDDYLN